MRITYLGHACFLLEGKRKVLIDPFLLGNPTAPVGPGDVNADIIVVTHLHGDHLGDAVEIARKTGAKVVCIFEVAERLRSEGIETIGGNIGGFMHVNDIDIALTPALHSGGGMGIYAPPVGAIVRMNGKTVYHVGDTGLFSDMKLIGELFKPDVACIPIGGWYTMDVEQAARAVEFIQPKIAIPMHYNTFDPIKADPQRFKQLVEARCKTEVMVLQPGEQMEI